MRTLYMTDKSNYTYYSKTDCERAEAEEIKREQEWAASMSLNSAEAKLSRLKEELLRCLDVHPSTIATCSWESIRIKAMVRVCQQFAEANKEYLNYY